jgi:hypothetical protein
MGGQKQSSMAAKKKSPVENPTGPADCSRPHLVIPCRVAPQHCPTPFHQAGDNLYDKPDVEVINESLAGKWKPIAAPPKSRGEIDIVAGPPQGGLTRRVDWSAPTYILLAANADWLTSAELQCSRLNNSMRGKKDFRKSRLTNPLTKDFT